MSDDSLKHHADDGMIFAWFRADARRLRRETGSAVQVERIRQAKPRRVAIDLAGGGYTPTAELWASAWRRAA